jgi:hypothetical protein
MRTQAATAAPAMAFAGTTPLSGGGTELIPMGAAATTAREGVGLGLVDRVLVVVVVAVAVEVSVPVPVAEVLEGGVGVGANPDPDPVGVPVAELDGTIYTVPVAV